MSNNSFPRTLPFVILSASVLLVAGTLIALAVMSRNATVIPPTVPASPSMTLSSVPGCNAGNAAGYLRVATEQDGVTVHILIDNKIVESRTFGNPVNPKIYKVISGHGYVSFEPSGLGGYVPYGNAFQLEKVDICSGGQTELVAFSEIVSTGHVVDISPDEKTLAVRRDWVNATHPISLDLYDARNGQLIASYPLPNKNYTTFDAKFSPDGTKIAVAAAVGNPDNESGTLYTFDMASKKFLDTAQSTSPDCGGYYTLNGWKADGTIDATAPTCSVLPKAQ